MKKTQKEVVDICKNESAVVAHEPFSGDDRQFIQNLTGKCSIPVWCYIFTMNTFSDGGRNNNKSKTNPNIGWNPPHPPPLPPLGPNFWPLPVLVT